VVRHRSQRQGGVGGSADSGAYGFSDEYNVERYLRNSKGAVIYEGTSEIHQLMQAGYKLSARQDRPLREEWQAE